jgi:hypothetical protein
MMMMMMVMMSLKRRSRGSEGGSSMPQVGRTREGVVGIMASHGSRLDDPSIGKRRIPWSPKLSVPAIGFFLHWWVVLQTPTCPPRRPA